MTNDQNRTDLEVAKDLKKLTEVIDNSLYRANAILKQAKEVEEIRIVIAEVRTSRDQLIESQREAGEIGDQLSQRLEDLQTLETNIRQLDAQVSRNLEAVESCGNLLDELTQAKRELEEIGVTSLLEQARLILEDVNNFRAESQKILLTTQNYLEQSQQVKEENLAIYTANATRINESISQIDTYNQNIDAQVSQNLENLQSFSNILKELREARRELEEIGVTSLVEQAILILEDVNNVRAESQKILLTTQNYLEQSQQIKEDNLAISTANAASINQAISQIDRYNQNIEAQVSQNLEYLQSFGSILKELREAKRELEEIGVTSFVEQAILIIDNAKGILTQLESIKSEIEGIGGLDEIRNLLQQVDNARVELRNSNHQLSLLQGEIREIQYLENYLQDFGRVRNHKQLRQFLRQELGFIGLIVYVLHLLTRNRKR